MSEAPTLDDPEKSETWQDAHSRLVRGFHDRNRSSHRDILSWRRQRACDADRTASSICWGFIGVRLNSTLKGRSASDTAFAITAGGAMGPPSPTPLTPSGLSGEGECWWIRCMSGISQAVGTM